MSDAREYAVDSVTYVLEPDGADYRVGHRLDGDVRWLPERIPTADLDLDDESAVAAVLRAVGDRGA